MEEDGNTIIVSSDEESLPCKIRKKILDIEETYSDENETTSNEINKHCKTSQKKKKLSKQTEILPKTVQKYHFQEFNNTGIKLKKKKDDIISLNEDELRSNEIKENDNMPQKNYKLLKQVELTKVKDKHKDLLSCDENDKKNKKNSNTLNKENNVSKNQSTSKDNTTKIVLSPEFENFLKTCKSYNYDTKYKSMMLKNIPNIKCKYYDAKNKFINSEAFKNLLIRETERMQQNPKDAILIFSDIYRELERRQKQDIILSDQEKRHLKKLYSMLKKVYKKVKKLESKEVDFDEDNNSSYIMLERYKERLCSIQKKICSYTKENFYSGRYLFRNLDFSSSKYSEINRLIDKLYNKKKQFPSFYEVNQSIRKCVKNNNINLTEEALAKEILSVYKALGIILQRRRKTELYDALSYFLDGSKDDPADQDPELAALLEIRQEENDKKINEILQKYTDRQERGEDTEEPSLSSDSDDSHHVSDDCDYSGK